MRGILLARMPRFESTLRTIMDHLYSQIVEKIRYLPFEDI